ncbi:septal ring lytic transglycosylase RlpA family protein [Rubritalea marina]|uniref:septal ring lytic transglycosylase RlpA family protein n=1 Tax=Rubritalea marina TaxID=361055 RepID=UPI00035D5444|nr:septal ring lytic transglycosylase RlpA family protein [Rubritalea marina]
MKSIWLAAGLCTLALNLSSCALTNKQERVEYKGQVYTVASTEHGKMSWYSVKTNRGTATASGETFTNHGHTAAHKTLPMGTMVRVTNLKNNTSKILRINDRGPFKKGRIIDVAVGVSHNKDLDFHVDGVVPCKVEVLQPLPVK